jgi:hypothetical protein
MMTEFDDDLVARLRGLGSRPVDPAVAAEHLTAMAAVRAGRTRPAGRFQRLKVGAAFAAGIVLGGTSLASAGVMGQTVQDKVADAAAHVNVNLPGGTERYGVGAPECAGYTAGTNHGQWVKAHKGDPEAANSDCGKPMSSVDKAHNDANENGSDHGSACRPPWAGKGKNAKDIKAENSNWQRPAACAADDQGENENETTGTANNGVGPNGTTPSTAAVTPPGGGQDDNAGVPSGGSVPGVNEQGDEHRDGATASTLPPEANGNATDGADNGDQNREGAGASTTTTLP